MSKPRKIGQLQNPIVYQTARRNGKSALALEWIKKQAEQGNDIRVIRKKGKE